jgi:hypothetical protein
MVYVSPDTERFFLSRETLIQLNIISKNFPEVGGAREISALEHKKSSCGCLSRTLPPERPNHLPFTCCPKNNSKMKDWLLTRYAGIYVQQVSSSATTRNDRSTRKNPRRSTRISNSYTLLP